MASLAPLKQHYHKTDGTIASGYYLTFYAGGTTTPQNTYTDAGGGTPNTNPVQLNSRGEASIWYDPTLTYKVVFSSDALATDVIWTMDLVGSIPDSSVFVVDEKGTAIPSAATINLQAATGNYVHVTGNVGITSITLNEGISRWVTFDGTPTLTHSANLILPNAGSNITVAANDAMCFRGEGTGVVRCVAYMRYGGYYTKAEAAQINGSASQVFSIAAATAAAHAVRADQIQGGSVTAFTTGGTGTAYTLTPAPAITAYTANQMFDVIFTDACGAAPTIAISGLATPPNLVKQNPSDGTYSNLASGDFPAGWQSKIKLVSASQALVINLPVLKQHTSVSLSGTSTELTNTIRAGANRIVIAFEALSTNGTSPPVIQLGDSGGYETTGYVGYTDANAGASGTTYSAVNGYSLSGGWAANVTFHGIIILVRISGNKWAFQVGGASELPATYQGNGTKTLTAELTSIRVTTAGGVDTFDAGVAVVQDEV